MSDELILTEQPNISFWMHENMTQLKITNCKSVTIHRLGLVIIERRLRKAEPSPVTTPSE